MAPSVLQPRDLIRRPKKESGVFCHENLLRLKTRIGLSTDKALELSSAIQHVMGQKSVEPYFNKAIYQQNHTLDDFFTYENVTVTRKGGDEIKEEVRPLIYCTEFEALVSVLLLTRDIVEERDGY